MATEVILPRVDMDMSEGKIAHWYVKDGDRVKKGQLLFEIETDKAAMEVDSPADGIMHGICGEVGVTMPVGRVVGWILAHDEASPTTGAAPAASQGAAAPAALDAELPAPATLGSAVLQASPGKGASPLLRATPLARSAARRAGIDLTTLTGSGPQGRILGRDVMTARPDSRDPDLDDRPEIHLAWLRRGSGTPLLLIHGFGAELGSWRALVQQLPESRSVIALDLPSHGKSGVRDIESLQELAGMVSQRLDQEAVAGCHLAGHSLGGGVALALAQVAAPRVRSVTLLAPVGLGPEINATFIEGLLQADDEAALRSTLLDLFHDPAGLTGGFVATAQQQLRAPSRRSALARMATRLMPRGWQSQSLLPVLAGLQVPAQLIWGRSDRIVPARHALAALEVAPRLGVHLLPEVGHLPQVEATALVGWLLERQIGGVAEPA